MSYTRWQQATLNGLRRYSARHRTRLIEGTQLVQEELAAISAEVGSQGRTPAQTLSRVLQELRRMQVLHHVERGVDLLLDTPITVDAEELPDAAIEVALNHDGLLLPDTPTGDVAVLGRRRRGQAKLRQLALANYRSKCGLCDVTATELLIASHIVRWGDDVEARGKLSNVLCLCRMHDALFEFGYIGVSDDLRLLVRPGGGSTTINFLQRTADRLRVPAAHPPLPLYLQRHRQRAGFDPSPDRQPDAVLQHATGPRHHRPRRPSLPTR